MAYDTSRLVTVGHAKAIHDAEQSQIDDIKGIVDGFVQADIDTSVSGWRLTESSGMCASNSSYKLLKYKVSAGYTLKVVSDDRFQFQTVASVPSSGTSNRVGVTYQTGEYIVTVPDTATYLIVSTPVSDSTADVYVRYDAVSKLSDKVGEVTKSETIDVLGVATKHTSEFYNVNNVVYPGNNQWDYYTLPVKMGDKFDIDTVAGGTVRAWAFRDEDGNQLSIDSYSGDVAQKEYENVITPMGASELIVNHKTGVGTLSIVRNGAVLINENRIIYDGHTLPYYLDNVNEKSNVLRGKTLVCCGDSITYGADIGDDGITDNPTVDVFQYSAYSKTWTKKTSEVTMPYGYQIAERNSMVFYNGGVSGATVQGSDLTGSDVPGFSVADGEYTLLPNSIDYLLIWYGWNDNAFGTVGTISDETNDSYYGGFNVTLPYLIDKYPDTKIGLIVPFGASAQHREAVRLLGNKWGVAVFDNYKGGTPLYYGKEDSVGVDSDIVTANREKYQANGAHPNYKGHKQLADMIENWMRGI